MFLFNGGRMLVRCRAHHPPEIPTHNDLNRIAPIDTVIRIGTLEATACFAAELSELTAPSGWSWHSLRQLFDELPHAELEAAGRAAQLLHWHNTHRYCGRCGRPTEDSFVVRSRVCPECSHQSFPRISPAIIVAVIRENRILLARGPHFRPGVFSVLAGFVDPGESLETAVHREVREEVGIEIERVRYFGSQSWPFPDSLMTAFFADHAGGDLSIDGTEIIEANWFTVGQLPSLPSRASISRALIDRFVEQHPDEC
jgi:NAD+ diphosphatase